MQPMLIEHGLIKTLLQNTDEDLQTMGAIHRINCLAGLKAASHGWLGACFSSIELLATIYYRHINAPLLPINKRASVHLSKGHASMAQYAILAALGAFPVSDLLSYKDIGGLPAHCDRNVPGVDSDSGSLGQGLSKAIGVALANRQSGNNFPVFALIGDGELQEGQVFEALLTLKKQNLTNCVAIIDRNHLQSDSQTSHIKDADNWAQVFEGIGLQTLTIDGHSVADINKAINCALTGDRPTIIIAKTRKGYGTELTSMSPETPRRQGHWHGQIPDDEQYLQMLAELVGKTDSAAVKELFQLYKNSFTVASSGKKASLGSTGEAFGRALLKLGKDDSEIMVLDADLEKSCRLTEVAAAFGSRFVEVGISEQDMCSIATGMGLAGKIAVVNTYGSFYKRSLDQIFNAATEKVPVIFAAHYSGADYFSDGKSHQAINDIGLIRAIADIDIYQPLNSTETEEILSHVLCTMKKRIKAGESNRPAYIRLHRSGCKTAEMLGGGFVPYRPRFFEVSEGLVPNIIFTSGPHMTSIAIEAAQKLKIENIALKVVCISHYADDEKLLKSLIAKAGKIFVLEDHRTETGLGGFIANLEFRNPVRIGAKSYTQSSRTLEQMFEYHQLTAATVCRVVKKVISCSHNK